MKSLLLSVLVLGAALGVGHLLRAMDADVTGKAVGSGDARIEVYRTEAGRDFRDTCLAPASHFRRVDGQVEPAGAGSVEGAF